MGTTVQKLQRILETKTGFKDLITEKGGVITETTTFHEYIDEARKLMEGGKVVVEEVNGTAIKPDDETNRVGDIYFNIYLTDEEILDYVKNANCQWKEEEEGAKMLTLLDDDYSNTVTIGLMNMEGFEGVIIGAGAIEGGIVYYSPSLYPLLSASEVELPFEGWNPVLLENKGLYNYNDYTRWFNNKQNAIALKGLISSTPFGAGKQPVPNSGYVESIKFNTSLTPEEVDQIITDANLSYINAYGMTMYPVFMDVDTKAYIAVVDATSVLNTGTPAHQIINLGTEELLYSTPELTSLGASISGWNSNFNGVMEVKAEAHSDIAVYATQNDKLVDLVYIGSEPFKKELSGTYEAVTTDINENGEVDLTEYWSNQQMPIKVNVEVEATSNNDELIKALYSGVWPSTITEVTIPEGVTAIADSCFANSSIKEITLPATVKEIYPHAFSESSLEKINIESDTISLKGVRDSYRAIELQDNTGQRFGYTGIFEGTSLTNFDFSKLTDGYIPGECFYYIPLSEITEFPQNVKIIGDDGFYSSLENVEVLRSDKLEFVGYSGLAYCNLKEIDLSENVPSLTIFDMSFMGNGNLNKLVFNPNQVIKGVTNYNEDLENYEEIGSGETKNYEWYTCDMQIDNYIPVDCFGYCNLAEVRLPDSITTIGQCAFEYNENLNENGFYFPPNLTHIHSNAFEGCAFENLALPNTIQYVGDYAFKNNSKLKSLTLPDNLKFLGEGVCQGCPLETLTIPKNLTSLSTPMTYSNVNYIIHPENTSFIVSEEGNLFSNQGQRLVHLLPKNSLTSVLESPNLKEIGKDACRNHTNSYSSVVVPDTVEYIGSGAFYKLQTSTLTLPFVGDSLEPKEYTSIANLIGIETNYNIQTINITKQTKIPKDGLHSTALRYLTTVTIPENTTEIGEEAFYQSKLSSINLPDTITYIGDSAFAHCSNLSVSKLPANLTYLGKYAFIGCSKITSITIPEGITELTSAFNGCSNLTTINLHNKITKINDSALSSTKISSLEIPSSVQEIGIRAFYNCKSLTSIIIPDSVSIMGSDVFKNASNVTIYSMHPSQPESWNPNWNPDNRPVKWLGEW